jgi:alkanesulfonate monooxygenase SsuD/methylene tetrahydromethanopterin reductase-like flavin-dependent oxidoreductase (luciferase family)
MYGIERASVPQRYEEVRDALLAALTSTFLDFRSEHFEFRHVEITMRPLQQPHPPLWYGIANPDSTVWAAAHDVNVISLMPLGIAAPCLKRYREEWAKLGKPSDQLPAVGLLRHIVVAETESRPASRAPSLREMAGVVYGSVGAQPGAVSAGTPAPARLGRITIRASRCRHPGTVREFLADQTLAAGANFVLGQMVFGAMHEDEARHSLELFSQEVIPALVTR